MKHVVILPYYHESEIKRYLRIGKRLADFPEQEVAYEFLLASSPRIQPSVELYEYYSKIAPTTMFSCPTRIFGYPEGSTAMFWDCMDCVNQNFENDGGFALWLESDMVPVKYNWLDRLSQEWISNPSLPWMMGIHMPEITEKRILHRFKILVPEHINGGACYSKGFAELMPPEARKGVFDTAVFPYLKAHSRGRNTNLITFSNLAGCQRDATHPDRVLLHGLFQKKDLFIDRVLAVDPGQIRTITPNPVGEMINRAWGRIRVRLRRDRQSMVLDELFQKVGARNQKTSKAKNKNKVIGLGSPEKLKLLGKIKPKKNHPSLLFFTIHKSASVFVDTLLTQIAKMYSLIPVNLPNYIWGFPEAEVSEILGKEIMEFLPGTRNELSLEGRARLNQIFKKQGFYFGPFRLPNLLSVISQPEAYKILLMLRDPRDVLTSLYFSISFSHQMPKSETAKNRLLAERHAALSTTIDQFVLENAPLFFERYQMYCEAFLPRKNVKLVKYEDMIADPPAWLDEVLAFWDLDLSKRKKCKILKMDDFKIQEENVNFHKRQVKPGDHLRKLQPATINALTRQFKTVLEVLGYDSSTIKKAE